MLSSHRLEAKARPEGSRLLVSLSPVEAKVSRRLKPLQLFLVWLGVRVQDVLPQCVKGQAVSKATARDVVGNLADTLRRAKAKARVAPTVALSPLKRGRVKVRSLGENKVVLNIRLGDFVPPGECDSFRTVMKSLLTLMTVNGLKIGARHGNILTLGVVCHVSLVLVPCF